jgi:FecR protein
MRFARSIHTLILRKNLNGYCRQLALISLIGIITSCQDTTPKITSPVSSANNTPEQISSPQEAPATITEIQSQPVWLRRLKAVAEIAAAKGMAVQIGETIRTGEKARAQIDLKNGLAFRIGSNAVLTLKPDNSLNLRAGEMITWVTPGKHVPTQVITPGGVAGIRGTTIYIKMPKNPKGAIEFFTWEGTMFIHLPNQSEEFQLKAGEIVKIKPGETDISKIRASVRRLTSKEWLSRRRNNPLINKFDKPLPTLQKIDNTAPPMARMSSLTPISASDNKNQSTLPQPRNLSSPIPPSNPNNKNQSTLPQPRNLSSPIPHPNSQISIPKTVIYSPSATPIPTPAMKPMPIPKTPIITPNQGNFPTAKPSK